MLPLDIPGEVTIGPDNSVTTGPTVHVDLEHSLISISKWEAKYHKPFLTQEQKTPEEMADYIRFMAIGKVKDETVFERFSREHIRKINAYIQDTMTATKIKPSPGGKKKASSGSFVTSEVVYYWLVELGIPFEVEKWHFSRLVKLVETISEKRKPQKKMSRSDVLRRQSAANAMRKARSGTRG